MPSRSDSTSGHACDLWSRTIYLSRDGGNSRALMLWVSIGSLGANYRPRSRTGSGTADNSGLQPWSDHRQEAEFVPQKGLSNSSGESVGTGADTAQAVEIIKPGITFTRERS